MINDLSNKFYSKVIMVTPPIKTLTYPPVKDAMVYEGQPLLDYGDYTQLSVSPDADGKKFLTLLGWKNLNISKQAWAGLKSITLTLQTGYETKYANVLNLYEINDDTTWSEGNVNWIAKPAYSATPLITQNFAKESNMVTFDLTSYFKAKGNPTGTDFGFALQASNQTAEILSFSSKENTDAAAVPKLVITYYDLGLTPKIATVNGHITASAPITSADITCTVVPEGKYVEAGVYGHVEAGKGAITPVDINSKITVQQRLIYLMDGHLEVGKEAITPVDINAHFFGAGYITADIAGHFSTAHIALNAVDIAGKITVSTKLEDVDINGSLTVGKSEITPAEITGAVTAGKGKISKQDINGHITASAPITEVDIIGKVQPSYTLDPVDITSSATVGKGAITAVDITATASAAVPIDYVFVNGSATAGKGEMTAVDLDGHVSKVFGIAGTTEIPATFTLGRIATTAEEIACHIVVSQEMKPAVDITGKLQPSYAAPSVDIGGHIFVIPVVYEEIDGHIIAAATVDVDIDCHVIALQRLAAFVDGHITSAAYKKVDIDATVSVLAHGQTDINCQVTVDGYVPGTSYTFIV